MNQVSDQAEHIWEGWLDLSISNYTAAERKFRTLTANVSVPLSPKLLAAVSGKESAGDSSAQSGKLYDALHDYEAALQVLPAEWAPRDVEQRLEEKTIKVVLRMNPRPAIPQDAMRHEIYGITAARTAKGPADLDNAVEEFDKVLRLAPWWAGAYKNLATVLEKEQRYRAAARNLQLYLLAAPNAPDAQAMQKEVYSLQYQAQHPASTN